MPTTPTTRKVRLKRAVSLQAGDEITPSLGFFTKGGRRIARWADIQVLPASGAWTVVRAELDSSGLVVIDVKRGAVTATVWGSADAFVVLA